MWVLYSYQGIFQLVQVKPRGNTTGLQVKRVYIHMGCHKKTRVNIWFSTTSGFFKGSSRCYILVLTLSHTHTRYWSSTYYKHTNLWLGIYLPLGKELIWKIVGYSHRLCIVRSQLMCGLLVWKLKDMGILFPVGCSCEVSLIVQANNRSQAMDLYVLDKDKGHAHEKYLWLASQFISTWVYFSRIKSICKNQSQRVLYFLSKCYILGIGIIIIWSSSFIGCLNPRSLYIQGRVINCPIV